MQAILASPKHGAEPVDTSFSPATQPYHQNNGAVLNIAHIFKNLMSLANEAELAGLYYITARKVVYIRIILQELGHKQPPMSPQTTKNAMADAVINGKV